VAAEPLESDNPDRPNQPDQSGRPGQSPTRGAFAVPDTGEPLLRVRGLSVEYGSSSAPVVAVDNIDLDVAAGEFVGIVGESGCGKSTLLFAIAQLLSPPAQITAGSVHFGGRDLVAMNDRALAPVRWRDLSVVMQSAMNALNPVRRIGDQFRDVMRAHGQRSNAQIAQRGTEVMRLVGIDPAHLRSYPHQLSGGMRQRAMIAMALLFTPDLVIMDEPTSALDVVAQRSLMLQVKQLQRQLGFAVLFVTHDMSLVSHFSDRLLVMYAGQAVEFGDTRTVFDHPAHPYSQGLLDAFPSIRGPREPLLGIKGAPPDLANPPSGCRFHPRCPKVFEPCPTVPPALYEVGGVHARCLLHAPEYARDGKEDS
jgi:peptide/nickel transport system ATP-binding protein